MKFINKLFSADNPSWKAWILSDNSPDSLVSQPCSYLWKIINDELNTFRNLTYVKVHNGAATSFWFDHWVDSGPLFTTYPALFSHTTKPNVSVQYVFQHGFELHLRPRLTTTASQQLGALLATLQDFQLSNEHDVRLLKCTERPYTTRDAYAALDTAGEDEDQHGRRVWRTRVPSKVKVFAWLYFKDRLSTRSNLYSKHIVDNVTCERCSSADEDRHHVFFGCNESRNVWTALGIGSICNDDDDGVWSPALPPTLDKELWPFVLLTTLWRIWDARYGHIFRSERFCSHVVLHRVRDDLVTWMKRLPQKHVNSLLSWHAYICACICNSTPRHG